MHTPKAIKRYLELQIIESSVDVHLGAVKYGI